MQNMYSVEVHFLLVCPLYNNLEKKLFPTQWQTNLVCQLSFYNIMSDKNKRNIVQLSKYLYKAFELRNMYIQPDPIQSRL